MSQVMKILSVDNFTVKKNIPASFISMRYLTCNCGETFFTEDDINIHFLETEHKTIARDISTYQCNICTKVFDTEQLVNQHHVMIHQASLKEKRRLATKQYISKNSPCTICGKMLKSKVSLYIHMKIHSGVRPYQCAYCDKSFMFKTNLQNHIYCHTGERPFPCTTCPMRFRSASNLLRHYQIHAGIKPHKCKLCSNRYVSNSELKIHVNTVHLKIQAPYKRKPRGTGRPRMTITNYHTFV